MDEIRKLIKHLLLFLAVIVIAGCATTKEAANPQDPFETYNRAMFTFNTGVDKVIIRPVAKVYDTILPSPVKTGVDNFFSNLNEIPTVVNNLLQLDIGHALAASWRLFFNTTIGIGGLFDVATPFGLEKRRVDLGMTFTKWGANTPYLVLPILGPSTVGDTVGLLAQYELFTVYPYIYPWYLRWSMLSLYFIEIRQQLLPTDKLVDEAFDPYVFVRDAYLQHRKHMMNHDEEADDLLDDTFVEPTQS